jgi:glycolate oxidase FAD binding subunit
VSNGSFSDELVVSGIGTTQVVCPADEARLSEVLARANGNGTTCRLAGGSTKQEWGNPGRFDLLLSTAGLQGCTDVDPDNLTLSVAAGTTVAEARAQAAAVNRILPLDPGRPGRATIGGVAATGDQGARAVGYGGLRDVVLGIRATLADGSAVKFGGRTMKNVTGYDMTKLLVGSFGVLGVITEVTFRLLPRYDTQALVVLPFLSLEEAKASVARVLTSYLQPLALEVVSADVLPPDLATAAKPAASDAGGHPFLLAGFGGHRAAVDRSIREVTDAHSGAAPRVLWDSAAETLYEHLADGEAADAGAADGGALGLRAAVPISRALDVVLAAQIFAAGNGLTVGYRAGAARGRVDLLFTSAREDGAANKGPGTEAAPVDAFAACLSEIRARAAAMGGSLFVTAGAGALPPGYDAWGDVGPTLGLMKRIKERFDPNGILNPGRFVGGI